MTKKLQRPHEGTWVAGVLAGLARYFDQDPLLFRLLAIVVLIITGIFPGALLYFIAWLMIPKEQQVEYTVIE